MNLGLQLKKALLNLLKDDKAVESAKTESRRKQALHALTVSRANFEKAQKRVKRAKRQKALRDLGLGQ
jgi:hypothetical protein